jgi:hypothetical protein
VHELVVDHGVVTTAEGAEEPKVCFVPRAEEECGWSPVKGREEALKRLVLGGVATHQPRTGCTAGGAQLRCLSTQNASDPQVIV